jgi:hypothetical protein
LLPILFVFARASGLLPMELSSSKLEICSYLHMRVARCWQDRTSPCLEIGQIWKSANLVISFELISIFKVWTRNHLKLWDWIVKIKDYKDIITSVYFTLQDHKGSLFISSQSSSLRGRPRNLAFHAGSSPS